MARGAAGQLLFEEETVVTKIRVVAFLFSEAERQINGTAAVARLNVRTGRILNPNGYGYKYTYL